MPETSPTSDRLIPWNRLHLDLANPRHDPVGSEAEAIAYLCGAEKVMALAADIGEHGLNPLESLGVIPMAESPGHFIAVEGNRRTCALIVTADPERAPERFRARLRRIKEQGNFPSEVRVHVFRDKADAAFWFNLRHQGEQDGIGLKTWNPTQKSRALSGNSKASAKADALAVKILDRMEKLGQLSKEDRAKVSISTLTRYLSTPDVRKIFGIGDRTELVYTHAFDEVDRCLLRLVRDSITPRADGSFPVHSRTNADERRQYANELKAQGATPSTLLDEPAAPTGRADVSASENQSTQRARRSASNPDKRGFLVPRDFKICVKDDVLIRLRNEASRLDVEDYSFSANFLLRAIVERVLIGFLKQRGKWPQSGDLATLQTCAAELKQMDAPRSVQDVVQKASHKNSSYGLHTLGFAVHGGIIPTGSDLKKHFDTWRPALAFMLEQIE